MWKLNKFSKFSLTSRLILVATAACINTQFFIGQNLESPSSPLSNRSKPIMDASRKLFGDCTPPSKSAHDCAYIERLYEYRLSQLGEKSIDINPIESDVSSVVRIILVTPTSSITTRMMRIKIKNDDTSEITWKTVAQFENDVHLKQKTIATSKAKLFYVTFPWKEFELLPSLDPEDQKKRVIDGKLWLVEDVHNGQYHVIHRRVLPDSISKFIDEVRYLFPDDATL